MRYGDCRWVDIDSLDKGRVVVVCPIAALEQHGHHLPLLTDTYLAGEVARRVEAQLPQQVVLTPTMWLGASDHHLDFPGTISLPNTLYVEMIKGVVRCFLKAGFQRILLLNGHGGNIAPAQVALTELSNEMEPRNHSMLVFANYWDLAGDAWAPQEHGMESDQISHACEYETSMMLAAQGHLVKLDQAAAGRPIIDSPFYHSEHGGRVSMANRFHRLTATGAMGKPQAATPAKGESLLSAAADEAATFVREFLTWKAPPILKRR